MEDRFISSLIMHFFVAFGVVLGGTFIGGLGSLLARGPPVSSMFKLADQLKIWAIVAAIGGTIDVFRVLETGFLGGQLSPAAKQLCYILSAFSGAHIATLLLRWLLQGEST